MGSGRDEWVVGERDEREGVGREGREREGAEGGRADGGREWKREGEVGGEEGMTERGSGSEKRRREAA